ncbi:MAG: hypothetical protein ACREKH_13460 [Candidatus Rokuibacteriota bacterium]
MDAEFTWHIDLDGLIGQGVTIETIEGHLRTGRVVRIEHVEQRLLGSTVLTPDRLYINDETDFIEWRFIKEVRQP